MKITKEWLEKWGACSDGKKWFFAQKECNGIKVVQKLIKENYLDWANWTIARILNKKQRIQYAIFGAEQVLEMFEKKYPENKRPREAIEAAKKYLKKPTKENKAAVHAAAYAVAHAVAHAADHAAYADYTDYTADAAADAAYAAYAAAYAAYAAAHAAYAAHAAHADYIDYTADAAADAAYAAADAAYAAAHAAHAAHAAYAAAYAADAAAEMKKMIIEYGLKLLERV